VYRRISGVPRAHLKLSDGATTGRLLFDDTSACIIVRWPEQPFHPNMSYVQHVARERSHLNSLLLSLDDRNPIKPVLQAVCTAKRPAHMQSWPSYVFSFSIVACDSYAEMEAAGEIIKVIAEPALIGSDDLLPREHAGQVAWEQLDHELLKAIEDCDLTFHTKTYVTWATIASITSAQGQGLLETRAILEGLEMRLQMVWNRCHAMCKMVESIIDERSDGVATEEILISFSRAADDARSVLSSTVSTRAQHIFRRMIETSRIEDEIQRLEQKLALMEKYVQVIRSRRQQTYARTVELFLFVVAAVSVIEMLAGFPLFDIERETARVLAAAGRGVMALAGYFLIFRRPL
jgi:hypothetical protein